VPHRRKHIPDPNRERKIFKLARALQDQCSFELLKVSTRERIRVFARVPTRPVIIQGTRRAVKRALHRHYASVSAMKLDAVGKRNITELTFLVLDRA
jgi:hypothetical protein